MTQQTDFLPVIIPVKPSRRVTVLCYVGASSGTEHEFPWDDKGIADALDIAFSHADVGTDRDAHIFLSGTEYGLFLVRSYERRSDQDKRMTRTQNIAMLEASLRRQLTGRK